jgi:hypothetical protein
MGAMLRVAIAQVEASLTDHARRGNFKGAHRGNSARNGERAQAALDPQLKIPNEGRCQ